MPERDIKPSGRSTSAGKSHPAVREDDERHRDNLPPEQRREIGRKGGEAPHISRGSTSSEGKSHPAVREDDRRHRDNLSQEQRREIGRKGGEASHRSPR